MKQRHLLLRYIVIEGYRYARQTFANCLKRLHLLKRKPHYHPPLEFFRQYILHLMRIRRLWAITSDLPPYCAAREGPGSQALQIMRTISFARAFGLTYLHSPFSTIYYPDEPRPEWPAVWEKVFNLGAGETPCDGLKSGVVYNTYTLANLDLCFGWRDRKKQLDDQFKALIPEFRRKYYLNKSRRTTGELTVAINIRRGEVSASENAFMYTANDKILRIVNGVKSILETWAVPFNMKIYGQGKATDFPELSPLGAESFLGADPVWTMQELIEADILIMAKSCFSYYAGLISDGIKIFESDGWPRIDNVFIPPFMWELFLELDDWLPCQEDGSVDRAAFDRQLALLLQAKKKAETGELTRR
jgi:hypothetical protein